MPRVSIIIPSYNCAALAAEAIDSALAQTCREIEIILVDDGSTDDTAAALARYRRLPNFTYHHQENRGLPGARNSGIRLARGEYILVLDADDQIPPHCVQRHLDVLDREQTGWATCDVLRREGADERVVSSYLPSAGALAWALEHEFPIRSIFYRKSALEQVGLYDEEQRVYEDIELYARLLRAGIAHSYIPEPLYIYYIRGGSLTKEGKRLRNLGYMERFYRLHYRALADAGHGWAAREYARVMWRLGSRYRLVGAGAGRVLACLAQSLRYDPTQTLRAGLRRLIHPPAG